MPAPIQALIRGNNADLIAEVARLYATGNPKIADLTYGRGVFWRHCKHLRVFGSDIMTVSKRPHDFTALPYADNTFDIAVLDPPYIHSPGAHMTDSRYQNAATTRGMLQKDILALYVKGMAEAARIVRKPGGMVWVKCKDQVQSGMQRWAHVEIHDAAKSLGLWPRDLFVLHATSNTASGRWPVQHHARKPHSYLWVFEHPSRKQQAIIKRESL